MLLISIDCAIPKKNIEVISSIMTSHRYEISRRGRFAERYFVIFYIKRAIESLENWYDRDQESAKENESGRIPGVEREQSLARLGHRQADHDAVQPLGVVDHASALFLGRHLVRHRSPPPAFERNTGLDLGLRLLRPQPRAQGVRRGDPCAFPRFDA